MKFKAGDKVRYVKGSHPIGWESADYGERFLKEGEVYTVVRTSKGAEPPYTSSIHVNSPDEHIVFHPAHFVSTKLSNEERIAKRMEELHE